VHVRAVKATLRQGWHFEFGPVRFQPGDLHPTKIAGAFFQSVVHELVVAEQVPAVTVKTISAPQTARGIILGNDNWSRVS